MTGDLHDAGMTKPELQTLTLQDGRTLAFTSTGAPDGQPIVYFHGAPGSRLEGGPDSMFSVALASTGIRAIAFDRPGYGASTPHPERQVIDVAGDVTALLDELGLDRVAVIGWSAGCPHALASASRGGDRITAVGIIAGLAPIRDVGLDGVSERPLLELAATDKPRLRREVTKLAATMRADPLAATMGLFDGAFTDDDLAFASDPVVTDLMVASLREAAQLDLAGYADDLIALRDDWGFALTQVTQPVHIVHGRCDRLVPVAHGRHLADRLEASYRETDAGHLSVLREFVQLANEVAPQPQHRPSNGRS